MTHGPINQRKRLFINPYFQSRFLAYTMGIGVGLIAIFYAANSYFFWKFIRQGKDLGLPQDHIFFRFISEQQFAMNLIFLATSLVALTLIAMYGLYLSNRIAGPIYRVQTHLKSWLAGEKPGAIRFRKHDYFIELGDTIDAVLEQKSPDTRSKKKAS